MFILLLLKLLVMIVMFSLVVVFGLIPLRLNAFKTNLYLKSISGAFSGGLFLAVGLIHLLPDANN